MHATSGNEGMGAGARTASDQAADHANEEEDFVRLLEVFRTEPGTLANSELMGALLHMRLGAVFTDAVIQLSPSSVGTMHQQESCASSAGIADGEALAVTRFWSIHSITH